MDYLLVIAIVGVVLTLAITIATVVQNKAKNAFEDARQARLREAPIRKPATQATRIADVINTPAIPTRKPAPIKPAPVKNVSRPAPRAATQRTERRANNDTDSTVNYGSNYGSYGSSNDCGSSSSSSSDSGSSGGGCD